MIIDPFEIKNHSKLHPRRLIFTIIAKLIEKAARANFESYAIPLKTQNNLPPAPEYDQKATTVTPNQVQHLLYALKQAEKIEQGCIVEVGAFRGVTTKNLAKNTTLPVFAVDPFIGYGGAEDDYQVFKENIASLNNVSHIRKTSGSASKEWSHGPVAMVFIDAVHDYVNTRFDIDAWNKHLVPGGFLAMHDTDIQRNAGTRKAAFKIAREMELESHVDNLVILCKKKN